MPGFFVCLLQTCLGKMCSFMSLTHAETVLCNDRMTDRLVCLILKASSLGASLSGLLILLSDTCLKSEVPDWCLTGTSNGYTFTLL